MQSVVRGAEGAGWCVAPLAPSLTHSREKDPQSQWVTQGQGSKGREFGLRL